jgi:hypothetical protein
MLVLGICQLGMHIRALIPTSPGGPQMVVGPMAQLDGPVAGEKKWFDSAWRQYAGSNP